MNQPTPFDLDCRRKSELLMQLHDKKSRLRTCRCGVIRKYHAMEVMMGRCSGFEAMSLREWAEWIGADQK